MTELEGLLREVTETQRSEHDKQWARLCCRMLTDFGLRLSPEGYREVAGRLEREVLPTVPAALQQDTRELIRSLIQDAQYFAWLRDLFGAEWPTWRGQGHPRFGDLRGRFERERQLVRSPYASPYAPLPRPSAARPWTWEPSP